MLSREELRRSKDEYEKLENAYRLAKHELETVEARANIKHTPGSLPSRDDHPMHEVRILSPASGIVILRPVEVGEVVVSGIVSTVTGTKIFEIGDPSQMMVKADISEVDVRKLKTGLPARIIADAYPDTTYRGEVHSIAPVGQIQPGSVIVTFHTEIRILDLEPRLRQGMSCDVDIIISERDSTLYMPVESVYEDFGDRTRVGKKKGARGRFMVFRKQDDTFVECEVRIGLKSDVRLEVLSGLDFGDEIAADMETMERDRHTGTENRRGAN